MVVEYEVVQVAAIHLIGMAFVVKRCAEPLAGIAVGIMATSVVVEKESTL